MRDPFIAVYRYYCFLSVDRKLMYYRLFGIKLEYKDKTVWHTYGIFLVRGGTVRVCCRSLISTRRREAKILINPTSQSPNVNEIIKSLKRPCLFFPLLSIGFLLKFMNPLLTFSLAKTLTICPPLHLVLSSRTSFFHSRGTIFSAISGSISVLGALTLRPLYDLSCTPPILLDMSTRSTTVCYRVILLSRDSQKH